MGGQPLGFPIGPVAGERVIDIGHVNKAGAQGDLFALEAVGVAGAVPALVLVLDELSGFAVHLQVFEQIEADDRVLLDELLFGVIEGAALIQDGVGDGDLADVVDAGGEADGLDLVFGQFHLAGDLFGEIGDLFGVFGGVGVMFMEHVDEGFEGPLGLSAEFGVAAQGQVDADGGDEY